MGVVQVEARLGEVSHRLKQLIHVKDCRSRRTHVGNRSQFTGALLNAIFKCCVACLKLLRHRTETARKLSNFIRALDGGDFGIPVALTDSFCDLCKAAYWLSDTA